MQRTGHSLLPPSLLFAPRADEANPLILYHGKGCPDGFAAALAAWRFFCGKGEYLGLDHGQVRSVADLPALDGRAVYVLDFSFAPMLLREIDARCAKLVLLDHHKSAADSLAGFACRCGALHFDMHKSGARLAWEFFQPELRVPALVAHVEDRDLWNWKLEHSAAFLAALDMEAFDFPRWNAIAQMDEVALLEYMARGAAMDEKFTKLAADIAENAQEVVFNGHKGLMVNAPGVFHSLVGEMLSKRSGTFALMWTANQGVIKVGLRSQKPFDCIPLASSMGGGGHAQACGFKLRAEQLPGLLAGKLNATPL
ncbi:DHHA1 domain-containing protein [Curvibacter sp. APW13]|uniref:DHH family phosphoesterase n=1 Tax=Curvibacter sp. APW13 TaxID=3077236 RepID=UPI0028DF6C14|nr:DHHA1 domain-containing protein [Curvibacter sp. APW13]MDT8991957.1 DHHA1 domain-containing protein [Curvibacter sp. APW13]